MNSCLSPHLPLPQGACTKLDWYPSRNDERCRVTEWTCSCRSVYYELCQAGGLGFVRRVVQGEDPAVAETPRVRLAEARVMWRALLTGLAR
ncbi:hypothetical protein SAMN05660976_07064 [Nonomuraea pusilla]|uniref:Uncharacterized protein n=1 Tax=Nonomuraea pusilla TaxID=46177 RepID=A0A1H8EPP3_9ACTN|nr:hypothetical protein SAMN05660976_07064 [Nonomuraea pusilla]